MWQRIRKKFFRMNESFAPKMYPMTCETEHLRCSRDGEKQRTQRHAKLIPLAFVYLTVAALGEHSGQHEARQRNRDHRGRHLPKAKSTRPRATPPCNN